MSTTPLIGTRVHASVNLPISVTIKPSVVSVQSLAPFDVAPPVGGSLNAQRVENSLVRIHRIPPPSSLGLLRLSTLSLLVANY
jgi:hypothetical protein